MTGPGPDGVGDTERPGPPLLEIGRIVKPHGIRGEVVVEPVTNRAERFAPGAAHEASGAALVVERARRHQGRWVVAYEGIADRTAAESYRGVPLFGEPLETLDEGEWWLHEVVGRPVVDLAGVSHGRVVAVEANPAHDILVLDSGGLIPVVFVTDVDAERVLVDPPPGLLDADLVAANRAGVERRPARRKGGGGGPPPRAPS